MQIILAQGSQSARFPMLIEPFSFQATQPIAEHARNRPQNLVSALRHISGAPSVVRVSGCQSMAIPKGLGLMDVFFFEHFELTPFGSSV